MKIISNINEIATFALLEGCIEALREDKTSSASKNEKINKLKEMKKKFIEEKTEQFLNDKEV